jgi:peptide/nickel transport system substrate-binding protein
MALKRGRKWGATVGALLGVLALVGTARCSRSNEPTALPADRPILRIGISNVPALATERGVQQFVINQTSEGLLRVNQEGRVEAWLAESWSRSKDGLRLEIRLRPGVTFHDGTPADANAIVTILNEQLNKTLRATADDVESIRANGDREIVIIFRRPSALFAETLMDVQIAKPGTPSIGVGAFKPAPEGHSPGGAQVVAHDGYYLGRPALGGLVVNTYPNVRAAWADMLRDRLDMLYEVGLDAMDAMHDSSKASLYTFDRPYQYTIFLNPRSPKLKSPAVRQALNEAIDRDAFVRDAMGGHGTPSAGPVSPHHWAFRPGGGTFTYAPQRAVAKIPRGMTLKCVTLADPPFEQLALAVKQQLREVGIDLQIEQVGVEQMFATLAAPDFEAVLTDPSSGWSLVRAYRWWHSKGLSNQTKFASAAVDAALDRVRHAADDEEYRSAVAAFQQAVADDPPAIFLAWSQRSRAVSSRFDVQPQPGRDVLATLRLWHLSADKTNSQN